MRHEDEDDLDFEEIKIPRDKPKRDYRVLIPIFIVLLLVAVIITVIIRIEQNKEVKEPDNMVSVTEQKEDEPDTGAQSIDTQNTEDNTDASQPGRTETTQMPESEAESQGTESNQSSENSQNTGSSESAGTVQAGQMTFQEVNEKVTAKESTNLRDIPSQGDGSAVMTILANGETADRTGVNEEFGWSRVVYNGETYYAVSSYLTTDLNYQATQSKEAGSGDGLKTKFTEVNDVVTAKIEVNLRALPSVTNPDATVAAVLHNGETVTRTGVNEDYGWSRVDYNGQTLYCVSSYVTTVAQ